MVDTTTTLLVTDTLQWDMKIYKNANSSRKVVVPWVLGSMLPGISCCPVIPMGGIPRLFMAVAQALGSDMGIVIELESIDMLQIPSAGVRVTDKGVSAASVTSQQ